VHAMFEVSITMNIGDGRSALFWRDHWLVGHSIQSMAPNLCNAVHARTPATRLVCEALQNDCWIRDIHGTLDMASLEQYVMLWDRLQGFQLDERVADRFIWKWSANQQYSSQSVYRAFFNGQCGVLGANILRKAKAPLNSKFFVWLALLDRCWIGERLLHHQMSDDGSCTFCSQEEESIGRLLGCSFTREEWWRLLARRGLQALCLEPDDSMVDWWMSSRKKLTKSSRRGFDSMVVLVWWSV
jgi:hypothetical protein